MPVMKIILSPEEPGQHENGDRNNGEETSDHSDPEDFLYAIQDRLPCTIDQQGK